MLLMDECLLRLAVGQNDIPFTFIFSLEMSTQGAGKKYNIPEATLRHKVSGYHRMGCKPVRKPLLTEAEETVLKYIRGTHKQAHLVTKSNVLNAVKNHLGGRSCTRYYPQMTTLILWIYFKAKMVNPL